LFSIIPQIPERFVHFADDYVLLADVTDETFHTVRYVEDLNVVQERGKSQWQKSLWQTFDLLQRHSYVGYNFETHMPVMFTKQWIFEAYREFRDYVTEDRFYGPLGPTTILNYAYRRDRFRLLKRDDEGAFVGFVEDAPSLKQIHSECVGKTFLNFDDATFNEDMKQFLNQRFPEPSRFEA
jgi:hypothetical protein